MDTVKEKKTVVMVSREKWRTVRGHAGTRAEGQRKSATAPSSSNVQACSRNKM